MVSTARRQNCVSPKLRKLYSYMETAVTNSDALWFGRAYKISIDIGKDGKLSRWRPPSRNLLEHFLPYLTSNEVRRYSLHINGLTGFIAADYMRPLIVALMHCDQSLHLNSEVMPLLSMSIGALVISRRYIFPGISCLSSCVPITSHAFLGYHY
jgi:hypothetical protein